MIGEMPKFFNSEWFVMEPGNWHLKDGAPQELVKEFEAYMKGQEDAIDYDGDVDDEEDEDIDE